MVKKVHNRFLNKAEYAEKALAGCREFAAGAMRNDFSSFVDDVRISQDRVVITRHGRAVAGIVSLQDMEKLFEYDWVIDEGLARVEVRPVGEDEGVSVGALLAATAEDDSEAFVPQKRAAAVPAKKIAMRKRRARKVKHAAGQVATKRLMTSW